MGNFQNNGYQSRYGISEDKSIGKLRENIRVSVPIDLLTKVLVKKTMEEDPTQEGTITRNIFKNHVFPQYPDIGDRIFSLFLTKSGMCSSDNIITENNFGIQADKILNLSSYKNQTLTYLSMYSKNSIEINSDDFKCFLFDLYKISTDFYPEERKCCEHLSNTIQTVIEATFCKTLAHTVENLSLWIENHCYRLITLMHCFVTCTLGTSYRDNAESYAKVVTETNKSTVLNEKCSSLNEELTLPLSQLWILSTTLSNIYTSPENEENTSKNELFISNITTKLVEVPIPTHWHSLYNSYKHGLSSNRFIYHVLHYKGPTVTFLEGEGIEFCIGIDKEWHENSQYWGSKDCIVIQTHPLYKVIEKGEKIIYLNFSIRGYPHGIRFGKYPSNPFVSINEGFDKLIFSSGDTVKLNSVKVLGCGTKQIRELQLDIRKWEHKHVQNQGTSKIKSSDWLDSTDRYLLNLARRTN